MNGQIGEIDIDGQTRPLGSQWEVGADESLGVGDVYYSVGTSVADLKTGSPNISMTAGTATLTVAQTGNIGLGDEIDYADKPMDALDGADALILVTEWNEFRRPDFDAVKEKLRDAVIFDGRNIYSRKTLEAHGFTYYGIGV